MDAADFHSALVKRGFEFYTGVPDSLLKDFCAFVTGRVSDPARHVIAASEGAAVGIATGYHLATGKAPVVYMQNSGLGNATNPLLSLADKRVYGIPMLLLIGWRGEPGKHDAPQHLVQGERTRDMLAAMDISYAVLPDVDMDAALEEAAECISQGACFALLVRRGAIAPSKSEVPLPTTEHEVDPGLLSREECIRCIVEGTDADRDVLVSTTGFTSRELFEIRERRGQDHRRDFLTVGSMGHASAIALGIALVETERLVLCLDGDGAALMHMGTIGTIGTAPGTSNLRHIVLNNNCHDSVGGQPTRGWDIDFCGVATACGYADAFTASTEAEIAAGMERLRTATTQGPVMMEVRCNRGARADLGRPKGSPVANKEEFMSFLGPT